MNTIEERLKELVEFIESQDNAELSDGEVLDYTIDELKKLTNNYEEVEPCDECGYVDDAVASHYEECSKLQES